MLRILALSDVSRWENQASLVARYHPDVVVLAGDVTSDGAAGFWRDAFEAIPSYREARQRALQARGITTRAHEGYEAIQGGSLLDVMRIEWEVQSDFRGRREFHDARRRLHTEPFYAFLRQAGRVARVLVVRGDHDDDFDGDYDPERINQTRGCREISGERVTVGGTTFLGLAFRDCERRTRLRALAGDEQPDVIVCHPRQRVLQHVAAIGARVIVRGHFGSGQFLVDGIPAAFTAGGYAIIQLPKRGAPRIQSSDRRESLLTDRYAWLAPYPPRRNARRGTRRRDDRS